MYFNLLSLVFNNLLIKYVSLIMRIINGLNSVRSDALDHTGRYSHLVCDWVRNPETDSTAIKNFTNEDLEIFYSPPSIKRKYSRHLIEYIKKLSEEDRKIVEEYYYNKKMQKEITSLSQGGVSHRLKRIKKDLKFYIDNQAYLELKLIKPLLTEDEIILVEYKLLLMSTRHVAFLLGISQPCAHNYWHTILNKIRVASNLNHKLRPYLKMLEELNGMSHYQSWTPERRQNKSQYIIARHRAVLAPPML